jgi:prepilin-type N-terminal cleavage/methylation domain-containing protein/prepilin-type processing-associated H-X9-DG protein
MKRNNKGFTLIELLVVISIIAILLGILVPSLRKVKEHAQTIICQNNLSQYYLSMELYLQDSNDNFPCPWSGVYKNQTTEFCQWHDALNTLDRYPENAGPFFVYLGPGEIHKCPFLKKAAKIANWQHPRDNKPYHTTVGFEVQYSYSQNAYLGWASATSGGIYGVKKKNQIRYSTSSVFLFAEENPWLSQPQSVNPDGPFYYDQVYSNYGLNDTALMVSGPNDFVIRDCFASYHNAPSGDYAKGLANVLFMDGHLDLKSFKDSYKYAWPKNKPKY